MRAHGELTEVARAVECMDRLRSPLRWPSRCARCRAGRSARGGSRTACEKEILPSFARARVGRVGSTRPRKAPRPDCQRTRKSGRQLDPASVSGSASCRRLRSPSPPAGSLPTRPRSTTSSSRGKSWRREPRPWRAPRPRSPPTTLAVQVHPQAHPPRPARMSRGSRSTPPGGKVRVLELRIDLARSTHPSRGDRRRSARPARRAPRRAPQRVSP